MAMSPTFNPGYTQPVDKLLGTAYPVVKAVYDQLGMIGYLATNIDGLTAQTLANRDAAATSAQQAAASALAASLDAADTENDKLATQAGAASTQENANLAEASRINAEEAETSAQAWSSLVGAAVTPGLYSAKEWAIGSATRGQANGGSAKDWASYTGSTVDGTEYSAKHYAQEAAAVLDDTEQVLVDVTNLYYGSRALDPVTRPDGTAMQMGDRYFSTSSNAEKVYNGAAWAIPNVGAADLLNSSDPAKGSNLVGHAGTTVRAALLAQQGFIDSLNAGTTADAGALLDADVAFLSRGAGVLDTPLSTLAAYVLAKQVIPGAARLTGLQATMVTNTLTATVGRVVAVNPTGTVLAGAPVGALTCDVTVAGPVLGGRDQAAAFSANSWVHFFYVTDGTNWGIIASASSNAPTLPAGYTHRAYLGTIRKEAANMRDVRLFGSMVHFNSPVGLIINGTATSSTDLSATVVANIPAQASRFDLLCRFRLTADGSGIVSGQSYAYDTNGAPSILLCQADMQGLTPSTNIYAGSMTYTKVNNQQLWYQALVANGSAPQTTIEATNYVVPNGDN